MSSLFTPFQQFFGKSGPSVNSNPLAGGTLEFLKEGTTDTRLDTFSDSALQNPNTNPVVLDGEGRLPNLIFGKGIYNVILKSKATTANPNGVLIDQLDPIGGDSGVTSAFDLYEDDVIYNKFALVTDDNGIRYESQINGNFDNTPSTSAETIWKRIGFVQNQITSFTTQHFYRNR